MPRDATHARVAGEGARASQASSQSGDDAAPGGQRADLRIPTPHRHGWRSGRGGVAGSRRRQRMCTGDRYGPRNGIGRAKRPAGRPAVPTTTEPASRAALQPSFSSLCPGPEAAEGASTKHLWVAISRRTSIDCWKLILGSIPHISTKTEEPFWVAARTARRRRATRTATGGWCYPTPAMPMRVPSRSVK